MMSLKSIELQIALPRTYDAGKLQEQLQQRGQLMNDYASLSVKREELKKETTVMKQERKDQLMFNKNDKKGGYQHQEKEKSKKDQHEKTKEQHPYKGTYLDFSG